MNIRRALGEAARLLAASHISNPRLTAEVLLSHCLGGRREYLIAHDEDELDPAAHQAFNDAVRKRLAGMPLQYITGWQEFYGYSFRVTPAVLIPRPETENIIDAVLEADPRQGTRIFDVGTGSGCVAVTLAKEIEGAHIFASDISESALQVALYNANNLETNIRFVCMDLLEAVMAEFDFIVSNPPYVPRGDVSVVQREVLEHEPHIALFAPDDPLAMYRRLVLAARDHLRPGGYLIMEIGLGFEEGVHALLGPAWRKLPTKADLQGIPRTVVAQKIP